MIFKFYQIRFISVGIMLFFGLTAYLPAQELTEYFRRYEFGVGVEKGSIDEHFLFNNTTIPGRYYSSQVTLFSISSGLHIPLFEVSQGMAIGINSNLHLLIGRSYYDPDGELGFEDEELSASGLVRISFPILATFKYGTDATFIPQSTTGFGVGIGYQPWVIFGSDLSMNQVIAMGEASFVIADRLWKFRVLAPLGSITVDRGVDIQSFNFSIIYLPGVGGEE